MYLYFELEPNITGLMHFLPFSASTTLKIIIGVICLLDIPIFIFAIYKTSYLGSRNFLDSLLEFFTFLSFLSSHR